jgi:hypothetical protein
MDAFPTRSPAKETLLGLLPTHTQSTYFRHFLSISSKHIHFNKLNLKITDVTEKFRNHQWFFSFFPQQLHRYLFTKLKLV